MNRRCLGLPGQSCAALVSKGRCPLCARRYRERHRHAVAVKMRDGYRCAKCGARGVPLQAHHEHPLALGGADAPGNMVTLCDDCHKAAHARQS